MAVVNIARHQGSRRWLYFAGLGLATELFLLALFIWLPDSSWLASRVRNLVLLTHGPFLRLMPDGGDFAEFFFFVFCLSPVWAVVWFACYRSQCWLEQHILRTRRARIAAVSGLCLTLMAGVGLGIAAALPANPTPFTPSPEVESVIEGNSRFALDLHQKLSQSPGNLFYSPFSISTVMGMVFAGARQRTAGEMADVMHWRASSNAVPSAFGRLTGRLKEIEGWNRLTIQLGNCLWCAKDYNVEQSFRDAARSNYHAAVLQTDLDSAGKGIDDWVAENTKGHIADVVGKQPLPQDTRLLLCNTIYFKGRWQKKFDAGETRPEPFLVNSDEVVSIPMMHAGNRFKMVRIREDGLGFSLLELPYFGRDCSMVILLPEGEFNLTDVEKCLTATNLQDWLKELSSRDERELSVTLPRFTFSQTLELGGVLKAMGMNEAFGQSANFSGIDGKGRLYLSQVWQKSMVEVSESGTEAAVATVATVTTKGSPEVFQADHPFLFLIRDNGSGTILFIGRVVDPSKICQM